MSQTYDLLYSSMSKVLTEKVVEDTEQAILDEYIDTPDRIYLLTNQINGTEVEAIFTSHDKATRHMIRIGTNFCVDTYCGMLYDMKKDGDTTQPPDFLNYVKEFIKDYYKIHEIDHIDASKPIYGIQNYNYHVYGEPHEYLTNSKEIWRSKQPKRNRWSDEVFGDVMAKISDGDSTCESDEWLETCTIELDPELPVHANLMNG